MSRKAKRRCAGATLVEMIVSFAMLAIFLAAATAALTAALRIYNRLQEDSRARNVSGMILDRIEGQLAAAGDYPVVISDGAGTLLNADGSVHASLDEAGSCICFQTEDGSLSCIYAPAAGTQAADSGRFVQHYYPYGAITATDWTYDPQAMMHYEVESLRFAALDGNPAAVEIRLTLRSQTTGYTCTATRCVECLHLAESGAQQITAGAIWQDGDFTGG